MRLRTAALMLWLASGVGLALATSAFADNAAAPAPKAGRFTMVPAEGGFVRLDTETGIVSHCRREGEGDAAAWHCAAISEDVLATPDPVTALKAEVDQLQKQVAALRQSLDKLSEAKAAAPPPSALPSPSSRLDPESERELNFSEELMRRFFGMIREMKQAEQADRT